MKRKGSKQSDLQYFLRNRNTLYVVLFFAVMNLFSYLMLKQLDAVAFFIIIGFLATYFSKNMIIVLLTSMVSTFLLVQIRMLGNNGREGMEPMDASGNEMTDPTTADTTAEAAAPAAAEETKKAAPAAAGTEGAVKSAVSTLVAAASPSAGAKTTEKFTQQLNPARYNASDDDDTPRHKPKVDYSATLESAYDNLDKLLSSDAIRNMSEDTSRLAEKQQKLMGNIQKLTPIMDKASSVLNGLDLGGISGLMNGIQERMKGFGGKEAEAK
jgi:hypothetical protein